MNRKKLPLALSLGSGVIGGLVLLGGLAKCIYNHVSAGNLFQNTPVVKRVGDIEKELDALTPRRVLEIVQDESEFKRYQDLRREEIFLKAGDEYNSAIKSAREIRKSGNSYSLTGSLAG